MCGDTLKLEAHNFARAMHFPLSLVQLESQWMTKALGDASSMREYQGSIAPFDTPSLGNLARIIRAYSIAVADYQDAVLTQRPLTDEQRQYLADSGRLQSDPDFRASTLRFAVTSNCAFATSGQLSDQFFEPRFGVLVDEGRWPPTVFPAPGTAFLQPATPYVAKEGGCEYLVTLILEGRTFEAPADPSHVFTAEPHYALLRSRVKQNAPLRLFVPAVPATVELERARANIRVEQLEEEHATELSSLRAENEQFRQHVQRLQRENAGEGPSSALAPHTAPYTTLTGPSMPAALRALRPEGMPHSIAAAAATYSPDWLADLMGQLPSASATAGVATTAAPVHNAPISLADYLAASPVAQPTPRAPAPAAPVAAPTPNAPGFIAQQASAMPVPRMPPPPEFSGEMGTKALNWLRSMQRYWRFNLSTCPGYEVTYALARMQENPLHWYNSTLGVKYGPEGHNCPPEEFVAAFTARFIVPDAMQHARKRFIALRQNKLDIRTYNERFNAALLDVRAVPGDSGISASSAAYAYLESLQEKLRERMSLTLPDMPSKSLDELQLHAVQCAEAMKFAQHVAPTPMDVDSALPMGQKSARQTRGCGSRPKHADSPMQARPQAKQGKSAELLAAQRAKYGDSYLPAAFMRQMPKEQREAHVKGHKRVQLSPRDMDYWEQETIRQYETEGPPRVRGQGRHLAGGTGGRGAGQDRQKRARFNSMQAPMRGPPGAQGYAGPPAGQPPPGAPPPYAWAPAWPAPYPGYPPHGGRGVSAYAPHVTCMPSHLGYWMDPNPQQATAAVQTTEHMPSTHTPVQQPTGSAGTELPGPPVWHASATVCSGMHRAEQPDGDSELHMLFSVHAERMTGTPNRKKQQQKLRVLMDSGSTHSFLSQHYMAFGATTGSVATVRMGNGLQQPAEVAVAKLHFGGMTFDHTVGIMPMNSEFDVVLGQDWLDKYSGVLSYDRNDPDLIGRDERHCSFKDPLSGKLHKVPVPKHLQESYLNSVVWNTCAAMRAQAMRAMPADTDPEAQSFI